MSIIYLTSTLSCKARFCMFIINGYYTKSKRLQSLDSLLEYVIIYTVCHLTRQEILQMKLQRQHLKQYVKFIYTENAVRIVLFVALLWPPKIYFDRWFFYFSVHGERQRNIYLQRWISGDDGKESRGFYTVHQNRANCSTYFSLQQILGRSQPS